MIDVIEMIVTDVYFDLIEVMVREEHIRSELALTSDTSHTCGNTGRFHSQAHHASEGRCGFDQDDCGQGAWCQTRHRNCS